VYSARALQSLYRSGKESENKLENDRFKIYDRCPMTDVAMAISTNTDADVADLDHLVTS